MRNPVLVRVAYEWQEWMVGSAAALIGFGAAHVIEDFAYGVPARFGLDLAPAATLVGIVFGLHVVFIGLAAASRVAGYLGNGLFAAGWLALVASEHLGELMLGSPFRSGWPSRLIVLGVMISAAVLLVSSAAGWYRSRQALPWSRGRSA